MLIFDLGDEKMTAQELENRLIDFAVASVGVVEALISIHK